MAWKNIYMSDDVMNSPLSCLTSSGLTFSVKR